MYQRCFDNASETLFVAGKTPRLSRFAFSDDRNGGPDITFMTMKPS